MFIILSSLPNFCLAIPEILSASFTLSAEKKIESFSFNLQIFTNSLIAFSEKNFPIGPFPINFPLFFSNIIYPSPLAPSSLAQLLYPSKKLLGLEDVLGAGIALTTPPFSITFLKISNFTSSLLKISVMSNLEKN